MKLLSSLPSFQTTAILLLASISSLLHLPRTYSLSTKTASTSSSSTPRMNNNSRNTNIVKNVAVPGLKNGMDYSKLGDSDLIVSKVCMGTMTFGQQNTLTDGVTQLNCAFDEYGINFLDTAEMYPVPTKPETQGLTDQAVATFLKGRNRNDVILATKVSGRAERIDWLPRRQPKTTPSLTAEQIVDSVEASLKRLQTDYIDLLQLHWPDRYTGQLFGQPDFTPTMYESSPTPVEFAETLKGLQKVIDSGKVRYVGVSNETPYGVCSMVNLAQAFPDLYPKICSIQNSYSLVVRKDYEAGCAEACYHHNIGLLPYSPLAGGSLTGKYRAAHNADEVPAHYRLKLFTGFMDRYLGSQNEAAVNAYCDLAAKHNLTPTQLALSWCFHNELVASTIIGATSLQQLNEDIQSYDIHLNDDIIQSIDAIYKQYTDPTKQAAAQK